jgi:hypothetical protein
VGRPPPRRMAVRSRAPGQPPRSPAGTASPERNVPRPAAAVKEPGRRNRYRRSSLARRSARGTARYRCRNGLRRRGRWRLCRC